MSSGINPNFSAWNGVLYNSNRTKLLQYNECCFEDNITVDSSVNTIGYGALCGLISLKSVNLMRVNNIEDYAFYDCENLEKVDMKDWMSSIGNFAFSRCTKLVDINLSDKIESIGVGAFEDCDNLESINIPSSLTRIEERTFSGCN